MINTKTLNADFITTLLGAGLGASALEGDGDIAGAAIGLGVGAYTGSKVKIDLPKFDRFIQRNQTIKITNKPVSELERIREELTEKIKKQSEGFDFLSSNSKVDFDKKDLFNTLTNKNIGDVVSGSTDISELKTIASVLRNENNVEKIKLDDLDIDYRPKEQIRRSHTNSSAAEKKRILSRYFQEKGYLGDELEAKLNLFSKHLESDTNLVIDTEKNIVKADGRDYKISSNFEGAQGISSYVDGDNYSAVRKVNPFADMYLDKGKKNLNGSAIAQALGINFADAAKDAAIAAQIDDYMKYGAKPEDIKALLGNSSSFTEASLDSYISKAYQHLEYESGFRVLGESQKDIESKRATDLARRISKQTSVHQVLSYDEEKGVNTNRPFRSFSSVARNEEGSELQNYISKLSKDLGINNLQQEIKADHAHLINTQGGVGGLNVLSPAERNQSTTGSRTNPVGINKNSKNGVINAFRTLREKGLVHREYSTSSAMSRITVDAEKFNLVSNYYNDKAILSLGDGSSLGKKSVRSDYTHTGYKKYDIFSKNMSEIVLSDELQAHVIARERLGIDPDAPVLKTKSYTSLFAKLTGVSKTEAELLNGNQNKKTKKDLIKIQSRRKDLEKSIIQSERAVQKEIKDTLQNLDSDSGNAKALQSILDSMSLDSKEGAKRFRDYNSTANYRFGPGSLLGINPNGTEVRLSEEFRNYKLVKASKNVDSNSKASLGFVFEGNSNTGAHDLIKDFGTSGKESVKNISDLDFEKSVGIASFLNKTGYTPEIDSSNNLVFNLFDKDGAVIESKSYLDVLPDIERETEVARTSGVAMITDTGGAGQKLSTEISGILNGTVDGSLDDLKLEEGLKSKVKEIALNIPAEVSALNLDQEDVVKATRAKNWSLGQLATSLTEGKATSESVMGLGVLGLKNLRNLSDTFYADPDSVTKEGRYARAILETTFGSDIFDLDPQDFKVNIENTFLERVSRTMEAFSSQNLPKNVSNGEIYNPEIRSVYDMAYLQEGESTHIASSDISSAMRTGSGSRGKTLSHTAQLHLKLMGHTVEDLAVFGQQSAADIYDLRFITDMGKDMPKEVTINSFLENKTPEYKSNFLSRISRAEPEQINDFLIKEQVPQHIIDQDFLYYGVENKNSQGIRTIPIHKYSTTRVGSHVMDDGAIINKKLQGLVTNLVMSDQDLTRIGETQLEVYEQNASILKNKVANNFINPNNPQMKAALALEVPNSTYSVVKHISSTRFDNVVSKYAEEGKSVVGFTKASAMQTLRGQGFEVTEENFSSFLNEDNMLMTKLTNGDVVENLVLENREPAVSSNSVRYTYINVLDESELGESGTKGVYHSSKDKHYSALMFGDFDMDHTLVYDSQRQMTPEEYSSRLDFANKLASGRNELIDLSSDLAIKGANADTKLDYSLDTLIRETRDKLPQLNLQENSPEYFEHLVQEQEKRLQNAFRKGGSRKSVSPAVTQMSVSMAENIYQASSVNGKEATVLDRQIMGTIGHSLVENLLKMQHIDTADFGSTSQLPVETLIAARSSLSKSFTQDNISNYKDLYRSTVKSMFKTEDTFKKYEGHVESMLDADINYIKDPSKRPSNTMDISKNFGRIMEEGIGTTGQIIEDVASATHSTQLNALPMDSNDINIERSIKVGYNDLLINAKQNLIKNKFPLLVGAGGLALGALVTQKDPNFKPSNKARADTGSMMLAPNVVSQEQSKQSDPMILKNLGRVATDYIGPETSLQDISHSVKQTVKIQGSYQHFEQEMSDNMKEAIFGNNISNVRIEREYD